MITLSRQKAHGPIENTHPIVWTLWSANYSEMAGYHTWTVTFFRATCSKCKDCYKVYHTVEFPKSKGVIQFAFHRKLKAMMKKWHRTNNLETSTTAIFCKRTIISRLRNVTSQFIKEIRWQTDSMPRLKIWLPNKNQRWCVKLTLRTLSSRFKLSGAKLTGS